ncbi:hypothetical protein [Glaciibacter sp. 2TAF33]|uniref:hypothetical protein n=1 Tax=Glaciibacter sp. 2TAF33 TaxID=3233015 RepID=UPI003F93D2A3
MWGRHGKHRGSGDSARGSADALNPGFDGLEGSFDEERRRAAAASHERIEPYGHTDEPPFPDTKAPLTHP